MSEAKSEPKIPFQFEALEDFVSGLTQSSYATGMRYTVRHGNERLKVLAMRWEKEGKVKILEDAAVPTGASRVAGRGRVH